MNDFLHDTAPLKFISIYTIKWNALHFFNSAVIDVNYRNIKWCIN